MTTVDHENPIYIRDFAPTLWPEVGTQFAGRFQRLERGPENEYGIPIIAVFDMVSGTDRDGRDLAGVGERGLWLIHSVAKNAMRELRPAVGELVAGVYYGKKLKKGHEDLPADKQRHYHRWQFVCPERPDSPAQELTWDSATLDAATTED